MSDNPFQAPIKQPSHYHPAQGGPQGFGRSYVKQVPVIASLMIAQGVLHLILAIICVGYAFLFSNLDSFLPPDEQQPEVTEQMMSVVSIVCIVLSVAAGILSILHFVAAYFGFNYKHRVFGIATMILGLSTILTFYCAPTSIGLAVYGLIIYFNPAVVKAFQLRKSGMDKKEMLAHFPS